MPVDDERPNVVQQAPAGRRGSAPAALPPSLANLQDDDEYPSSDGQPRAENTWQAEAMTDLLLILRNWFRHRRDVFVAVDLLVYFEEGNRDARVAPDVFVTLGAEAGHRWNYKVWEEGPPQFVMEVASRSTAIHDATTKKTIYERMGVREYWLYDPIGEFLDPRLQAFELRGLGYESVPRQRSSGTGFAIESTVLGLEFRYEEERLRIWDPTARGYLRGLLEEAEAREMAEARARAEADGRAAAEAKLRAQAIASERAEEERKRLISRIAELEAANKPDR